MLPSLTNSRHRALRFLFQYLTALLTQLIIDGGITNGGGIYTTSVTFQSDNAFLALLGISARTLQWDGSLLRRFSIGGAIRCDDTSVLEFGINADYPGGYDLLTPAVACLKWLESL